MPASRPLLTLVRQSTLKRRSTLVRVGLVAVAFYAAWMAIGEYGRFYDFFDMKIYHGAMVWWANGGELYSYADPKVALGFTYPPFAALTMLPMTWFSMITAGWINVLFGFISLTFVVAVLVGPIAARYGWPKWFVIGLSVAAFTAIEPIRESLGFGQVNLILFALIIADFIALRRGWRWAGVGIGLATAIKLTPALFIVYLLFSRQRRAALTAVGSATAATLVGYLFANRETVDYFTNVMWQTNRVGVADMTPNQSLAGLLARLYDTATAPSLLWIAFVLVILGIGLTRANSAHAEGDELTAFTIVGLTANIISPISWSHHLVFVVPAIIVLLDQALRRRTASRGLMARGRATPGLREPLWFPTLTGFRHATAAITLYVLFLVSPIWPYEHQMPRVSHYADGMIGVLAENSLIIALIAIVAALPWRPGAAPAFLGTNNNAMRRAALIEAIREPMPTRR